MSRRERTTLTKRRTARARVGAFAWLLVLLVVLPLLPLAGCTVEIMCGDSVLEVPRSRRDQVECPFVVVRETAEVTHGRPITLVGRDGTDLPLTRLDVRGTIEDPLAFTQLFLEFENPEPRSLDATLRVRLPQNARVTRFAVNIENSWREAEVVERAPGELQPSLYEPAEVAIEPTPDGDQHFEVLLPRVPGNAKHNQLILSYVETFDSAEMIYRVRVAGLHDIPQFNARVVVHSQPDPLLEVLAGSPLPSQLGIDEQGRRRLELSERDWSATQDFVVKTSNLRQTGVRSGRKVALRLNPLTHDHAAPIRNLTILFDTSASRVVGYEQRVEHLAELVEALHPWGLNLRLIAFDQGIEPIYEGPLAEIERSAFDRLQARRALGASNLTSALRHVYNEGGEIGDEPPADDELEPFGGNRVVLFSDGMATSGASERRALLDAVAKLGEVDIGRLDVVVDHGRRDLWTLESMVRELPDSGLVLDGSEAAKLIAHRLLRTVHDGVKISVPGARWYYPEVVDGLQWDDEVLVYADVETLEAGVPVTVESHGTDKDTWIVPLVDVEDSLVGWAIDYARVEFLVATLEDKAEGQSPVARSRLHEKIVQSSKLSRVVNDYTCLAMLGERSDYERARLDPEALPPYLFAGPAGVEVRDRVIPTALVEDEIPLAEARLPRFPRETLGIDRLLLLSQQDLSSDASGLSSAEADAVMAVGELVEPRPPAPLPTVEPTPDSAIGQLLRMRQAKPATGRTRRRAPPPSREPGDAYEGNLLTIMTLLEWGNVAEAKQVAWRWREKEPTEVLAVIALGEALEANAETDAAARVYGSIIDMYPDRADMRRFAGSRLEHLGTRSAGRLAIDTYRRARQQRPDHPSSHRLLAFSELRAGRTERAFDVLEAGLRRDWSATKSGVGQVGVAEVLREDLGLIAAVWLAREPERADEIRERAEQIGVEPETEPSLRFVLTWETGANDVDLHVRDVLGSHAYYENRGLATGGVLYYDVTSGYGPEVFTILGEPTGFPYNLQVHYYARGPNGYGMGKVQLVEHDGQGTLAFDERPFMVTKDRAVVDLGDLGASMLAGG